MMIELPKMRIMRVSKLIFFLSYSYFFFHSKKKNKNKHYAHNTHPKEAISSTTYL